MDYREKQQRERKARNGQRWNTQTEGRQAGSEAEGRQEEMSRLIHSVSARDPDGEGLALVRFSIWGINKVIVWRSNSPRQSGKHEAKVANILLVEFSDADMTL